MKPADLVRDFSGKESVFLALKLLLQTLAEIRKMLSFRECDIGNEQQSRDELPGRWGQDNIAFEIFLPPFSCQLLALQP